MYSNKGLVNGCVWTATGKDYFLWNWNETFVQGTEKAEFSNHFLLVRGYVYEITFDNEERCQYSLTSFVNNIFIPWLILQKKHHYIYDTAFQFLRNHAKIICITCIGYNNIFIQKVSQQMTFQFYLQKIKKWQMLFRNEFLFIYPTDLCIQRLYILK